MMSVPLQFCPVCTDRKESHAVYPDAEERYIYAGIGTDDNI
jgi:hypothetical protein